MNGVFCALLLAGVVYAAATGQAEAAQRALLHGGTEAVQLCLSLAGAYAFFGGLTALLREGGIAAGLARLLRKPLSRLFRFAEGEEVALEDICMNLSADMLGMGNAATPAGLCAMRAMASVQKEPEKASEAMLLFLILNTTSMQLLPTTMIALRAQAGAKNPADIVLPTLLATGAATGFAVVACRACAAWARKREGV
ncbi:MAG: spore maturation protein [Clostridia bacterium]|nr:spore maturation protein [Clostridia bacterium]